MSRPIMNKQYLHKTREVSAPIKEIWEKWTTHEGLKTFIGVDNKIELVSGGAFEIYFLMNNPPGLRGGEGNKVLSFIPQQMLSFTWNAPPTIPEVRDHKHKTWVVVTLKEVDDQITEVTLDHLGWLDGEKWDEAYAYFDKAWDIVLASLVESIT